MSPDNKDDNRRGENDGRPVFRVGGREIRPGDSLTPEEAEQLIRDVLAATEGPVSFEEVDQRSGTTVRSTVDKWAEFEQGPRLSEDRLSSFRQDLVRKGYLAFEYTDTGLMYHTAFRVLQRPYFADFDRFVRSQDIPASYFGTVIPGSSWFVSHRWATPTNPDPSRTQFELIREFVRRYDVDGIWYDYSCMPQEPHSPPEQKLFSDSLRHMNSLLMTTNVLSIESDDYLGRAWCYYERIVCELLCMGRRARMAREGTPELSDDTLTRFLVQGVVPTLTATKPSDLPLIRDLLDAGADLFKTLALATTFTLLNSLGFRFGVGTAARVSAFIDFEKFWTIWQVLAGSSEASGIRLPDLLNADRLRTILTRRHERFGTHARFFADLRRLMAQQLDMRVVEQASSARLASLLNEVAQSGPVPSAYTSLALIQLVYWIAGREHSGREPELKKTEKQRNPPLPRALCAEEVLVILALDAATPEVDDDWFEEIFQDLASELQPEGVWFGSWKTLRVPHLRIELPDARGEGMGLPAAVLDELRAWDAKQIKPGSTRLVRVVELTDVSGWAFVIHVPDVSPAEPS